MTYKPDGYTSLSPYLIVEEAEEVIEFLESTFEADLLRGQQRPDDSVMHAEVRLDDSILMIGSTDEELEPENSTLFVYVEDVDEVYERGLEAGGTPLQPPEQPEGQPDRRAALLGPQHNTWFIGTLMDEEHAME